MFTLLYFCIWVDTHCHVKLKFMIKISLYIHVAERKILVTASVQQVYFKYCFLSPPTLRHPTSNPLHIHISTHTHPPTTTQPYIHPTLHPLQFSVLPNTPYRAAKSTGAPLPEKKKYRQQKKNTIMFFLVFFLNPEKKKWGLRMLILVLEYGFWGIFPLDLHQGLDH